MEDITVQSPRVIRILGQNASPFTLQGTNCYLVGTGKSRILIDTGSGLWAFQELLQKAMKDNNVEKLDSVVLTHHHIDHIGGVKNLFSLVKDQKLLIYYYVGNNEVYWKEKDPPFEYVSLCENCLIFTEGATLEIWTTPGHTSDSVCIWLREEQALFSGDSILGDDKSPVIEELSSYLLSMSKLLALLDSYGPKVRIYPGHGPLIENGNGAIRLQIDKREQRNQEILTLLTNKWMTIDGLTTGIYSKIPKDLRMAARGNVKRHLQYLKELGLIREKKLEGISAYIRQTD
jgi:endoribonuclease LACTB2